jgi:hypothetical protein
MASRSSLDRVGNSFVFVVVDDNRRHGTLDGLAWLASELVVTVAAISLCRDGDSRCFAMDLCASLGLILVEDRKRVSPLTVCNY